MWKLPALEARSSSGAVDTDLIAVFQDVGKKVIPPTGSYAAQVEKFRKAEAFNGGLKAVQFLRFGGRGASENLCLVGLGGAPEITEEKIRQAGGAAWAKLMSEKVKSVAVHLDSFTAAFAGAKSGPSGIESARVARVFAEGLVLSAYGFTKYKSKAGKGVEEYTGPTKITFVAQDKSLLKQVDAELKTTLSVGEAVNLARDWSNEPSNIGTPSFYAAEAIRLARTYGLKCRILTEKEASREKMGLFLGVGQGSDQEGRIVVLEYTPKSKTRNSKTIAFVGKGVTFDSGGISIKPSMRMEEMKHDMTGAATVFGATVLAAKLGVPNRVISIMAFTENMPSGNAIQPGNVLISRAGKTVEIINTDAEGRLVLADALDYAQDFKPDAVIDVATLTGAVGVALGKQCCGLMGNDDGLMDSIRRAAERSSERVWQLPMWDEYFDDMKSETADMKNSCNDGAGGTIRGAMFLKQFIRKGVKWAHLDIASTGSNVSHLSYFPKRGASGAHVRTLAQFAADF